MAENTRMDSALTGSYAIPLPGDHVAPKPQFDSQVHKGESLDNSPEIGVVGTVSVSKESK